MLFCVTTRGPQRICTLLSRLGAASEASRVNCAVQCPFRDAAPAIVGASVLVDAGRPARPPPTGAAVRCQ